METRLVTKDRYKKYVEIKEKLDKCNIQHTDSVSYLRGLYRALYWCICSYSTCDDKF